MIPPKTLRTVAAAASGAAGTIVTLAFFAFPDLREKAHMIVARPFVDAGLGITIALILSIFLVYDRWFNADQIAKSLRQECDMLRDKLQVSEDSLQIDSITGIPNRERLRRDLQSFQSMMPKVAFQAILIDLEDFGRINDTFGLYAGDKVLYFLARSIYNSMRRNEAAYKLPPGSAISKEDRDRLLEAAKPADEAAPLDPERDWEEMYRTRRFYRQYPGGDEFVFVLQGSEADALGFLLRLSDRFETDFSPSVARLLGQHVWPLRFRAGLAPVDRSDDYNTLLQRLDFNLCRAKRPDSEFSVVWQSLRPNLGNEAALEPQPAGAIYNRAREKFARPPPP